MACSGSSAVVRQPLMKTSVRGTAHSMPLARRRRADDLVWVFVVPADQHVGDRSVHAAMAVEIEKLEAALLHARDRFLVRQRLVERSGADQLLELLQVTVPQRECACIGGCEQPQLRGRDARRGVDAGGPHGHADGMTETPEAGRADDAQLAVVRATAFEAIGTLPEVTAQLECIGILQCRLDGVVVEDRERQHLRRRFLQAQLHHARSPHGLLQGKHVTVFGRGS